MSGGFASNGYGLHSPGGYSLGACLLCEIVMTMFFLLVIMGSTDKRVPNGFAPIAIGLGLTLIHLISIPVTNTSVNPARSTGPALFVGGWALGQLWLFWVAPLVGGAIGGVVYNSIFSEYKEQTGSGRRRTGRSQRAEARSRLNSSATTCEDYPFRLRTLRKTPFCTTKVHP